LPLDVRVAIDDLRFEHEKSKPGEAFHAVHDLSVATPTIIASNIPLRDLLCVFDVAERAMGLPATRDLPAPAPRPKIGLVKTEAPRAEVAAQPVAPTHAKSVEVAPEAHR